jgi:AraC-like DNA-binding protein/quercetin dioxygenase-like cupin family protein
MSQKRHAPIFDRIGRSKSQIATLTWDYPPGYVVPLHFHNRDQLVYGTQGVMTVRTSEGAWVVPAHRGVWIPAGITHTITMSGKVAMRTLYLEPRLMAVKDLPRKCCVVTISPLLRELILHACTLPGLKRKISWQRHLIEIILDQLVVIQRVPLQLPNPSDARTRKIAAILVASPGDRRPLARLCRNAGASKRTIERLFLADTGMTFGKWRQQLRLMEAMRFLAEGAKVTHAALEAGYSTPSAFISMFRKCLGTTPRSYFSNQ